ncbi:adenosylhomocysteinase [Candidatus Berkelbacteria bacterium RBG_13_40_8]|uniref:Adenosylhomocysteinase n=1 Tax=Candidatus Berkelbacteria bacterium RBG_13_40_8 TaxID=1797467 RepID=A0A1F5DNJ2_9BACT|nr:MAG: adenosylhomocysteinase [Candidatus Berkelbacteria bacterium RBG_13_40_8]
MAFSEKSGSFKVKDISLALQGEKNIAWADSQMLALAKVRDGFRKEKPFKDLAVGMALHITKETANLVETLRAGGAEVAITGCNPLSTQNDVAAALAKRGVAIYGWRGETTKEYYDNLNLVIAFLRSALKKGKKLATIDDGCDLVSFIHQKHQDLIPGLIVGTEETTTGVIRLRAMEKDSALKYPVIAVNDNKTKHLFDNFYGTGQSTIDGIIRASSVLLAGRTLVIAGYGPCGQGVAKVARGEGASIIVAEVDPVRALQARMDGFQVMPMRKAANVGDIFVTLTGDINVITPDIIKLMKDGAILANSGHFDVEIDIKGLHKMAKKVELTRPGFEKFTLSNGKTVFLCGEGRLVNLACAEGHPSTVMSLSFCGQALAVEYGVKNAGRLENKIYVLPESVDQKIGFLQLEALGIKIDRLTPEQKKYLSSWDVGT